MRKANRREAREFEERKYVQYGHYHFEDMTDGSVWVLDGDDVDLSPESIRRMRTALSQFASRHGFRGSLQFKPEEGVVMVRLTPREEA